MYKRQDQCNVISPAERIKFGLSLGPILTFQSWLQKQPLISEGDEVVLEKGEDSNQEGPAEEETSGSSRAGPLPSKPNRGRLPSDATPAVTRSKTAGARRSSERELPTLGERSASSDSDQEESKTLSMDSCACDMSLPGEGEAFYTPTTVVEKVLRTVRNQGSYVPVMAGNVLSAWFRDPGSMLAQISTRRYETYKRAGVPMRVLESRRVVTRTTDCVSTVSMLMVMIQGLGFFDLSLKEKSSSVCTLVGVNPRLTVHDAVTGHNMLMDLHCSTYHITGVITAASGSGEPWSLSPIPSAHLAGKLIERYWKRVARGEVQHDTPAVSVAVVPVIPSPVLTNCSGTDSESDSSSSLDLEDISAKDCFVSPSMVKVDAKVKAARSKHSRSWKRLRHVTDRVTSISSPGQHIRHNIALANTNFPTPTLLKDSFRSGLEGAGQIIHVVSDSSDSSDSGTRVDAVPHSGTCVDAVPHPERREEKKLKAGPVSLKEHGRSRASSRPDYSHSGRASGGDTAGPAPPGETQDQIAADVLKRLGPGNQVVRSGSSRLPAQEVEEMSGLGV